MPDPAKAGLEGLIVAGKQDRAEACRTRHRGLPPGEGDAKVGVTRARKRSRSVLAGGKGASSAPFCTQIPDVWLSAAAALGLTYRLTASMLCRFNLHKPSS